MKKLLFVINTLGYGGAERALINLLGALEPETYQISLFVLTGQGELVHNLPPHVALLNTDYKDCSVLTKEGRKYLLKRVLQAGVCKGIFLKRAGYLLRNLYRMGKKKRIQVDKLCWRILAEGAPSLDEEYDLATAYLEGGATYYVADRVKARKKAAFVHIDYVQAGYGKELDLDCYQKMDHIFVVSDEVKEHFLEVYPEYGYKVSVFHNMVDQKRINHLAEEGEGFTDDFHGIRILSVGRLTEQKRYDVAIDAMARLKKTSPVPVRWYVLGEGELREQLEHQIQRLGIEKEFYLLGVKANPFPYYRECDLYVHATGYEGKSIAIQEAQTLGKPILATDCSGNREQIEQDVDGRLCQLDPQSISEEILWMIAHPERCKSYGQRAQQRRLYSTKGFDVFLALADSCERKRQADIKVLIIIPAYNEEKNLKRVITHLRQVCPQFDYVVVNDGSTDRTAEVCRQNQYPCISLPANLGIAGAVRAGMKYASQKGYDMALQFDADGQHLPEYIQKLVACMVQEQCDVVIGSRFLGGKMPLSIRTIGAKMIAAAIRLTTGKYLSDPTSGMRLYDKRIMEQFIKDENNTPEPDTLSYLFRLGADIREVKVEMADRIAGSSYLTPINASQYMIQMLMSIYVFQWFRDRKVML